MYRLILHMKIANPLKPFRLELNQKYGLIKKLSSFSDFFTKKKCKALKAMLFRQANFCNSLHFPHEKRNYYAKYV